MPHRRPPATALVAVATCLLALTASLVTGQEVAAGGDRPAVVTAANAAAAGAADPAAATAAKKQAAPKPTAPPPPIHKPDYSIYRTADQVREAVAALVAAHPDTMRLDVIGETGNDDGKPGSKKSGTTSAPYAANLTIVTVALGGLPEAVRASAPDPTAPITPAPAEAVSASIDPPGAWDGHYRLLASFGEHGRELITVEAGLALLELLALGADGAAAAATASSAAALAAALRSSAFIILPMENPGGRAAVEGGALCERKNGRGVDPNRNWALDWGGREPDYDPAEEYGGPSPFSEPEPTTLRVLATRFLPHAWVNAHSGMEALFMPFDHAASIPPGPGPAATLALLRSLNGPACGGRCAVGSGGAAVGYLAHGTATDWMWGALGVPVATTWEIYGDEAASTDDCFRMFNPLGGRPQVAEVAGRWGRAVLLLVGHLPGHPECVLGGEARRARAVQAEKAAAALDAAAALRAVAEGDMGSDSKEPAEKEEEVGQAPPAVKADGAAAAKLAPTDADAAAAAAAAVAARAAAAEEVASAAAAAFRERGGDAAAANPAGLGHPSRGVVAVVALLVAGGGVAAVARWRRRQAGAGSGGGGGGLPVAGAPGGGSLSPPRRLAP